MSPVPYGSEATWNGGEANRCHPADPVGFDITLDDALINALSHVYEIRTSSMTS
jgi:hypothetical protein